MCATGRSKFCYSNEVRSESTTSCTDSVMTFGSDIDTYSRDTAFDWNFRAFYQQYFNQTGKSGTWSFVNVVPDRYTTWHQGELDHTPNNNHGYMILINGGENGSEIFDFIFNNLCIGIHYEISVYVANINKPDSSNNVKPNILFQVRTATIDNYLVAELVTGDMDTYDRLIWFKYVFSFTASSSSVVLLMFSNALTNALGNNFVIDDIELHVCSSSLLSLLPNAPSLAKPLQIRQIQDVFITADILSVIYQWSLFSCVSSSCYNQIQLTIDDTKREFIIRSETLILGIYEVRCTILRKNNTSTYLSIASVFIKIVDAHFITNLVSLGRLNITHHYEHDLVLNPAKFTIAPDQLIFYPNKWYYRYYYRVYKPIEIIETFQLLNNIEFSQTSINISSQTLKLNQTYQFLVHMIHHDDSSFQSIGYLIVYVRDLMVQQESSPFFLVTSCSLSSMCSSISDFQYLNQHTELILISECFDNCPSIVNISWILSNQTLSSQYFQLFSGLNTEKLKIMSDFFDNHREIIYWQFQVIYSFQSGITINNTINITINKSPENGSCSIYPMNGTTETQFTIDCLKWFDSDGIKDYSYFGFIENSTKRFSFGTTSKSTYQLQFPSAVNQLTRYQLIINIRDVFSSTTEYHLSSSIIIFTNITINSLINLFDKFNQSSDNIVQEVSTLSNILNDLNEKNLETLIKNGISPSTISVSSLSTSPSYISNIDIPVEFDEELNKQAAIREALMIHLINVSSITIPDLKSHSSILSEVTQTTNQLTGRTATLASGKCYQLSQVLEVSSSKIPMKDIQTVSTYLLECASNVMTGINGPLQGRTKILTVDSNDECPLCFQQETANRVRNQTNEMISSITASLITNLDVNQSIFINTDSIYFSLQKLSINSLMNYTTNHVQLPSLSNQISKSNVVIRSMVEPLAFADGFQKEMTMNFSRSISFSLLDENGHEMSLNTTFDQPIEIFIPRDPNLIIRKMIEQNITNKSMFFNYHRYNLRENYSIHFEFHSLNQQISYLLTYRFHSSLNNIAGWKYFCSKKIDQIFTFYLDNNQTYNHQTVIFAIRELNSEEENKYCHNQTSNLLIINSLMKFSSNYEIRSYLSACFYLNKQNQWQSDGLLVGRLTNHLHTHCLSTHI